MNTTEFLSIASAIVPDRTAVIFEGERFTFDQLSSRVNQLANAFENIGIKQGDRIASIQVNSHQQVEAYFAAAKLDAIYVPLNFRARAEELTHMINECGAELLLVGARYSQEIQTLKSKITTVNNVVSMDGEVDEWMSYEKLLVQSSDEERFPISDGDDVTCILFTAGTTGTPKGVMLSHENFSSYVLSNVQPADPEEDGRNILTVPLYHIAGIQSVMSSVYGGRTLVIQKQFDPVGWMELVQSERVNRAMMVPTMLKMLMDHPDFGGYDLTSLDVITYGAAPMPIEVIKRAIKELPGVSFINAFGQTETAATITMLPPEDHILDGSEKEIELKLQRLTSIGRPLDDVEVRIVDTFGEPVDTGEVGEIVASGPRLMRGYWNQNDATSNVIRNGWLYTGDLGYYDQDGYIYLSGRVKDFVKRGGEMVSPEEVEKVLHSHPAIDEAAIIGVPDIDWGECVRAIVVLKQGFHATENEISEYCRERLASFKKPETVLFVESLPRNSMGKVLKTVLREEHGQ